MKRPVHTTLDPKAINDQMRFCFDKEFFLKSKYVLVAMGMASLYCIGYGIVLYHEFRKMGIIEILSQTL
ncbi:MAG: hypothetical protein EOO04_38260 [Chitinophagaceae bacterium]|nr:MAG: hypothetical protein EOO04_38260 [Chitinophagaceae bacterium]